MSERLTIRNFGPINEAEIDVRNLTIFVGPQATGKSLATQILYFLRGIEDLLLPEITPLAELETILFSMEGWFGNNPAAYTSLGTQLRWDLAKTTAETVHEMWWDHEGAHLSELLKSKVQHWLKWYYEGRLGEEEKPWSGLEQIYIPAGRTLYSFLPPYALAGRVLAAKEWPGYILTFYEILSNTITWLRREEQKRQDQFDNTPEAIFLKSRISSIVKGQIQYTPEIVCLQTMQQHFAPTTIAAGQMEIWPFWAIVEACLVSGKLDVPLVYFEEPEAHLHPKAQCQVMEIIAYLTQRGGQFLLTTHSPHILYAVNNFLMAQKVLNAGGELPPHVPAETALCADQVAVYHFCAEDGKAYDIMDRQVGLIDRNELDRVATNLNATFTALQKQLDGVASKV